MVFKSESLILFFGICILTFSCNDLHSTKPEIHKYAESRHGMIVSANSLASEAGKQVLIKGGNAIDAAIAVHFALAVVYPEAGNIGGGGFMVIRLKDGSSHTLDFRETAPAKAYETMYQDDQGLIKNNSSLLGHLSSGIPGSVDGMNKAHERFGNIDWKILIQPAIELADKGFPVTASQAASLNNNRNKFKEVNTISPEFLLKDLWQEGDILFEKELAATLRLIRDNKRNGFYQGKTAEYIVEEMKRGNGLITKADLDGYQSIWRDPVIGKFNDYKVISMGPPSSGGIALIQMLKMIEPFQADTIGWDNYKYIHLLCEIEKRAYADRAQYLGDSDFFPVPVEGLLDSLYTIKRMEEFSFDQITRNMTFGNLSRNIESEQTTHFSVIDKDGNAVAVTTTLNDSYGSRVVVAGSGFILNDEMDDFSIKPGFRNLFGLTGGKANSIQPGKRMLSSMTPTILEKNDSLYCVLGSPGGSRIITTVFQVILNIVNFKMPLADAVGTPRFHYQGIPDTIYFENSRINETAINKLEKLQYHLLIRNGMGRVNAVLIKNGLLIGAADPRGDDSASGI